jgi:8-oxo-dGTP pyrophosphatase MutT (NUDIX family)
MAGRGEGRRAGGRAERPARRQVSAGGVAFRLYEDRVQFALVRPAGRSLWVLPKGTLEPAERPEEAALREVQEETGLLVQPRGALGEIEYWFVERAGAGARGGRVHKRVHHFLFEAVGGGLEAHDEEMAEARWFEAAEGLRTLAFANERAILERAIRVTAALAAGPPSSPERLDALSPSGAEGKGEGGPAGEPPNSRTAEAPNTIGGGS